MKSLIVGMGIGNLYMDVLTKLGHTITTVDMDPNKHADYLDLTTALDEHPCFDTVHICTPNYTHEDIARQVAEHARIVFIEKPGVESALVWFNLTQDYPNTRFMMVKNNMWRNNIAELKAKARNASIVNIQWIRRNCIPHPGSWFTTRNLAYGGVSRDLMPHLLSIFIALNDDWDDTPLRSRTSSRRWDLKDIDSTEYGTINYNGIHDVDDNCSVMYGNKWNLEADWRSMDKEDSSIEFIFEDNTTDGFELGWCPEEAYYNMITDAIANVNVESYWDKQFRQDLWIHKQLELL